MPLLLLVFLGVTIAFPQFARFTLIAPILAFTFGGFFWSLAGCFNLVSFSIGSFMLFFCLAYVITIFATSK